ncbi:MAG: phage coat protein [Thomasclavelia ramosa]
MNTKFDSKSFNPEAFGKYVESVPRLKRNEILKSKAVVGSQTLAELFASQTGSHYARIPMFGQATANVVNYDGKTNIEADGSITFERGVFTLGRAFAKTEKDFSYDITSGVDFLSQVGNQCASIIDEIDQDILLAILKGIFAMTGAENLKFVNGHTYDVTTKGEGVVEAPTLNNAIQQASGQDKDKFTLAIMHSQIATNLENMRLLKYLTYTDANGITRDLAIATWNGRTVIIDDSVPVEDIYTLTKDVDVVPGKTYYTKKTSTYEVVSEPSKESIATYYELSVNYTTYVFGDGVIEKQPLPVKKPYEMSRDPKTNGGEDTLYHRWRNAYGVKGISYEKKSQASLSPTNEELAKGTNWVLANDGESKPTYYDHKAIAIARIISRG